MYLRFGGTRHPGNGYRGASVAALDFYSAGKAIYIDYIDKFQRAQIDG
jgi:aldehyde dehydrogenase (NAD+)